MSQPLPTAQHRLGTERLAVSALLVSAFPGTISCSAPCQHCPRVHHHSVASVQLRQ